MSLVLCLTRGGESGTQVENKAIALAKGRGESLVFLYIADLSFLNKLTVGVRRRCWKKELAQMGKFILSMALERALAGSVKAKAVIRSGKSREVLSLVVRELKATTVVLESPTGEPRVFETAELDQLPGVPG